MGQSISNKTVYDCQEVCKEFFQEKLSSSLSPMEAKINGRPVYDISGFDARHVVAVLSAIVNDKFTKNKTFYLLIRGSPEYTSQPGFEELFRLTARPTEHQPGNAIVVLRPRGKKRFDRSAKSYEELNGALRAFYDDTRSFAWHMKKLFKNNAEIDNLPEPTAEAYMLLLFEIARRLVNSENPSARKEALDDLPIASAIARLITLLESRRCSFEDVFLPGGWFHCFTGTPETRKRAIHNINDVISFSMTKEYHIKELQELFCSEMRRPAKMSFRFTDIPAPNIAFIETESFISLILILVALFILVTVKLISSVKSNGQWASHFQSFKSF